MTRTITYICDQCGEPIGPDQYRVTISVEAVAPDGRVVFRSGDLHSEHDLGAAANNLRDQIMTGWGIQ
ncbi:MAG TPA: hypothetical protein VF192_01225 [Longimicrobiales bacterium]